MSYEQVSVLHRTGQWCPGVRTEQNVIAYDMQILPDWQVPGRPTVDRCYVLVDAGIQLTQPVNFTGTFDGSWYVDLVDVEVVDDQRIVVHDPHLRDFDTPTPSSWSDFPPAAITPLIALPRFVVSDT